MRHPGKYLLYLLIFGITFIGCLLLPIFKANTDKYTGPQTVEALMKAYNARYSSQAENMKRAAATETYNGEKRHPEFTLADMDVKYPRKQWLQMLPNRGIVINENALPNIPGRIYVLKTESRAEIWHTGSTTRSESGEIISAKGSELSEKQKLDLLNTSAAPKGWEVMYVNEEGSPIYSDK